MAGRGIAPAPVLFCLAYSLSAPAASTVDPLNRSACGADIGWLDWKGDTNNGALRGEYVCSGYLYAANAGWMNSGLGLIAPDGPTTARLFIDTNLSDRLYRIQAIRPLAP